MWALGQKPHAVFSVYGNDHTNRYQNTVILLNGEKRLLKVQCVMFSRPASKIPLKTFHLKNCQSINNFNRLGRMVWETINVHPKFSLQL